MAKKTEVEELFHTIPFENDLVLDFPDGRLGRVCSICLKKEHGVLLRYTPLYTYNEMLAYLRGFSDCYSDETFKLN